MRVRVQQYKRGSKSAKALTTYLGAKRLKAMESRFVGKMEDVVVNWGSQKTVRGNARVLNKPNAVYNASNKLQTLNLLHREGVSIPEYVTDLSAVIEGTLWVARTKLSGHSGDGIVVGFKEEGELPIEAPLYTEYIDKVREYRAIVVGDKVVDFKQKKKKNSVTEDNPEGWEGEHNEHVWNLDGGYIFARNGIDKPDGIDELSIHAVSALSLDFGAVDIIEDREGILYVLEVNTAFGLEGTTIELVGEAIKELIYEES